MNAIRVQYRVHAGFVQQNIANIEALCSDLRATPIPGIHFSSFYLGDGRFMNINIIRDEVAMQLFNERASYIRYRSELIAGRPISGPDAEEMQLNGSNTDLI